MKGLLAITVIALIHGSYASLFIKGPSEPVLQGDPVTLECLTSDPQLNTSLVHFERLSKYRGWYRMQADMGYFRSRCFFFDFSVERDERSVVLSIPHASSYAEGRYRCVSDAHNATSQHNTSQPLTFKVHYMGELLVYRAGFSFRYLGYLGDTQDLKVQLGDEVVVECSVSSSEKPEYFWQKEGGDWILPSSKLMLGKVSALDGGEYTCVAQHPSVSSLSKRRTISITVLREDARWYESSNGRLMLMTSAAVVSFLVLILSMAVFLHCKAKQQTKTSKGPIDDRSQKKPIYKVSVESLAPSTSGDKQPLV